MLNWLHECCCLLHICFSSFFSVQCTVGIGISQFVDTAAVGFAYHVFASSGIVMNEIPGGINRTSDVH
jgi:hypothetical protein